MCVCVDGSANLCCMVRIPFAMNQNLSVFYTNTKRTGWAGCPFHALGVLHSPQVRGKLTCQWPYRCLTDWVIFFHQVFDPIHQWPYHGLTNRGFFFFFKHIFDPECQWPYHGLWDHFMVIVPRLLLQNSAPRERHQTWWRRTVFKEKVQIREGDGLTTSMTTAAHRIYRDYRRQTTYAPLDGRSTNI